MRKIFILLLSAVMIFSAVSCGADEPKTESSVSCENFSIKFSTQTESIKTLTVTPEELDWNALRDAGYKSVKITVSYKVSFEKQWGFGNIGYLGNPRYDLSILNSDGVVESFLGLETEDEPKSRTESHTMTLDDVADKEITLKFETTNIQNLISFGDVVVEYTVKK